MKKYKINEIFYSLQGEGFWTGTPVVFVRFAGCNLQCPWCDTDHNFKEELTAEQLGSRVASLCRIPSLHVVLTGGEPCLQLDDELLAELVTERGRQVHVETNGTVPFQCNTNLLCWVTVSPKYGTKIIEYPYSEAKVVFDGVNNPEQWYERISGTLYIQPCWPDVGLFDEHSIKIGDYKKACEKAMLVAVDYVKTHPWWKLSVQQHKLIGSR